MSITFKYKNNRKQNINRFLLIKGYSDNNIYYLIKNKNILVNNEVVKDKNHVVEAKSIVSVTLNDEENELIECKEKINIVYEDQYLLIVDKDKYDDVEPTKENNTTSLANKVTYYFNQNNIKSKIHLVNRLDKLTSGLVIIAKNQYIHNIMQRVNISKKYLALLKGRINKNGYINVKISKQEDSIKRIVDENGKESITYYKRVEYENDTSLANITLLTGRTHQIRVSFAHINHPLVGDPLYGSDEIENMYLRAYKVSFIHPITHKKIKITLTH